jgi:hypothetical protein
MSGSGILRLGFIAASLAAGLGAGAVAANAQEPKIEQCLDPEICPISYVRLSKQETEPFLFGGKVMDESQPRYKEYKKALRRFPDVRSCLIEGERDRPRPDLRQIDWGGIENIQEIDICVFRIASSIEDIDIIKYWLKIQEFIAANLSRSHSKNYKTSYDNEPVYYLSATLALEKFRDIIPRLWFEKLIGYEGVRGYSLTIHFSNKLEIVGIRSHGSSIFN